MRHSKLPSFLLISVLLISSCVKESSKNLAENEEPIEFDLPKDFILEDLYRPSMNGQGSWVALAEGSDQKLYACDQRGKIYSFNMPSEGEIIDASQVDSVNLNIGEANGLLWAHDALYVAVNKKWEEDIPDDEQNASGIYRLTDTDNDGKLDAMERLLKLDGRGEHGPHSFVPSPDGKEIYFIAGNHTLIPESITENSTLPVNWGEDNLFKPYLDARGHANEIKAPGGWIAKFKPDGSDWQIVSAGYRNPFDMAFNEDGELFAYDADMEWDIGMPWYRPTRICHAVSGSEYGWRTGSGKWPDYYPDALPAVHNLEQGSPTGVISTAGLNVPAKYKNGLFIMDWSFGTIYFIDLKPEGSSYTATREEFLSGTPLPLTDIIAGSDGNMYFATGGRGLDSHLYRLRYDGQGNSEVKADKIDAKAKALRALRQNIEKYHSATSNKGIEIAWNNLNHNDQFIRYASRIALEHRPPSEWQDRFFKEKDSTKLIEGAIALARQGDNSLQPKILDKLQPLKLEHLSDQEKLNLLRAYSLLFIRMGEPDAKHKNLVSRKLNAYFPHANNAVNRELGPLLLYLRADGVTEKLVQLLEKHTEAKTAETTNLLDEEVTSRSEQYGPLIREIIAKMPPSEAIFYGMLLSHADYGWTKSLRENYFQWFYEVMNSQGGLSFKAGLENIRLQAMTHVPEREKAYFQELTGVYSPSTAVADLPQPIGPGENYSGKDMNYMLWGGGMDEFEGTFEDGERAFKAGMCILCHRMRGEGGATGPDLTQAHTKFNNYDMMYAIYSPNDEISDQYAHTLFHTKDGKKIAGRMLSEDGDSITLAPNPFNESYTVQLAKSNVTKRELSPVSPMPSGLLNRLNMNEIMALNLYLRSGGDPNHEAWSGEERNQ